MDRVYGLLLGGDTDDDMRVQAAMVSAAIGGAVGHPLVMDLDDDTLRSHLVRLARRLFQMPG